MHRYHSDDRFGRIRRAGGAVKIVHHRSINGTTADSISPLQVEAQVGEVREAMAYGAIALTRMFLSP